MPKRDNIAAVILDRASETILFTTNDMLVNQLQRDGPRVARSFDRLANDHITACSGVFGRVCGMLLNQLQLPPDNSFKATTARLLSNACNSYVASIKVARHGFPRQYGAIARMVIETVATVIVIAVKQGALEQFHAGKLESSKCVAWAKNVLPMLGPLWGSLSTDFVHIGRRHALVELPSPYTEGHEAIGFLATSIRGNALLLYIIADLIFSDERARHLFWQRAGQEARFDPSPDVGAWMEEFLCHAKPIKGEADATVDSG